VVQRESEPAASPLSFWRLAPLLTLALTLLATLLVAHFVSTASHARDADRFEHAVRQANDAIQERLNIYIGILRSGTALLAVHEDLRQEEFAAYAKRLKLRENYPGIQGLGFAKRVLPEDLERVTERMRVEMDQAFRIHPDYERAVYFPIVFLEPQDERNRAALGYDMFSEPVRQRAMVRAMETGVPAASGRVTLVQEIHEEKQAGFLIYAPAYRGGGVPETVEERRATIIGFIYSPFRAGDLFAGIFGNDGSTRVQFSVYDGSDMAQEQLLYESEGTPSKAFFYSTARSLALGGHSWTLRFQATTEFEAGSYRDWTRWVWVGGLALSLLLFGVTRALATARTRAEAARRTAVDQREEYLVTLASIGDAVVATDRESRITFMNPMAEKLAGWSLAEAQHKRLNEIIRILDPRTAEPLPDPALKVLVEKRPQETPRYSILISRTGEEHRIEDSAAPIRTRAGLVVGVVLVFRDVSTKHAAEEERRRAEQALARSEEEYRTIFELSAVGKSQNDLEKGRFLRVNRKLCQVTGYAREELLDQSFQDLTHPDDQHDVWRRFQQVAAGEVSEDAIEARCIRKDGGLIWVSLTLALLRDADGQPLHILTGVVDITERKQAERGLREISDTLRAVIAASPVAIISTKTDGTITLWNHAAESLFGWSSEEVIGRSAVVFPGKKRGALGDEFAKLIAGECITGLETERQRKDGAMVSVSISAAPVRDERGRVTGVMAAVVDVAERKRLEKERADLLSREQTARREAEAARAHFRALFESAPGLYLVVDARDFAIAGVSDAYLRATESERNAIVGRNVFEVFPEVEEQPLEGVRNLRASLERVRETGVADVMGVQHYPINLPGRGVEDRYWSAVNSPVFGPEGEVAYIIHRVEDVTEFVQMKQAEGAGPDARRMLETRAQQMEAEIVLRTQELRKLNDELRASESRFRLIVENVKDFAIFTFDPDGKVVNWSPGAAEIFGYAEHEIVGRAGDVLFTSEDVAAGWPEEEREAAARDGSYVAERWLVRKDGRRFFANVAVRPIVDKSGRLREFAKVASDITARKRAEDLLERKVAERTVQLQETVSELEAFSYSVSHDLRAPLRAMQSFALALQEDFGDQLGDTGRDYIRRIVSSGSRLDRLIQDVLAYSRVIRSDLRIERVDLERLVQEIISHYQQLQEPEATVAVESPLMPVLGNEAFLAQCLSNLLGNAVKFVPREKKPVVRVRTEKLDSEVRVWIEDNGIGVAEKQRERIFRMFERVHSEKEFEGTGIGLAIVQKAVERMGGRTGVESQEGQGSRFWISLPHEKENDAAHTPG
jgi:PAS domain S-box-containing protein